MNKSDNPFDDLIDSVVIMSPGGLISGINTATLSLLGYAHKKDLLGHPMGKLCSNFSLKKITADLPLENCDMIYLTQRRKEIPMHVNITEHRDCSDVSLNSIIFCARNMSKTKDLIYELTQSRENLEGSYTALRDSKNEVIRSEKLAFTGRIAASIAHEIRNPLAIVIMAVQQLAKTFRSKNPGEKHVEMILRNAERINFLITELLNCARPAKLNMKDCDIHELLENVLASSKIKIESKGINVVKEFTSKSAVIRIDREQMERAFLNIVINAVDAMPEKGGLLTIVTAHNGSRFEVKIKDTGKGIPGGNIIRIFDPFFSSKQNGVGLGLTICYGVIVSHSGTIEVESKLKKGTTFVVSLPRGDYARN